MENKKMTKFTKAQKIDGRKERKARTDSNQRERKIAKMMIDVDCLIGSREKDWECAERREWLPNENAFREHHFVKVQHIFYASMENTMFNIVKRTKLQNSPNSNCN